MAVTVQLRSGALKKQRKLLFLFHNFQLMTLKRLWIIYWSGFFLIYLPMTREPDLFTCKQTKGKVISTEEHHFGYGYKTETHVNPVVQYQVGSEEYWFSPFQSENYFGIYQAGDEVTVLYDPANPHKVAIKGLLVYIINYTEIATALLFISIITILYGGIKNWKNNSEAGRDI